MSLSRPCRVAAALLATALLLILAPPASADTASDESRVLALIMQTRASVGAPALPVDATLASAARGWAAKMAHDGTLSHNAGVGSQVTASRLAENVGMGGSIDIVHQAFLNSPAHRANMVDTGVNALGVGVAWANGTVYIVQDYAQLASPPAVNRAPAVPGEPAPANVSVLRTAPTQASARYSDPDGTAGRVFFAVLDETGKVVRQVWSPVVCNGCRAGVSFAALPDGFYGLVTAAWDGTDASAVSPTWAFTVDRSAPLAPVALQRVGGNATAVYSDPDGTAGWLRVYVVNAGNVVINEGWTARACSGCTATYPLPALAAGTYRLYAIAYDGLLSPAVGPSPFTI
ncbi:MAG: hypothetical protein QOG43_2775 [Actinomycetota bacterium]|jgi:hypothetical protein|nr:hypothetical protein [Actinomycetota bacterium]